MRTFSIKKRGYLSLALSFAVLSILSVKLFIPDTNTNAATQTASQTVGPNSISMSNTDAVAINAIPTSEQTVYSGTNELSITNSCPSGATITLTTNSNSDTAVANNLVRSGSDSLSKTIPATSGNSLVNNSWGYSINNGSNYYAVPAKDETPATIYDSSSATSSAETVNVKYGIKMDNNIPSGNYSNDVVYTVAVKPACLSYTLSWDLNGGTGKTGASYDDVQMNYGDKINLTNYTPTREGYTFNGWSNGTSMFTGSETSVDVNDINARTLTLTAQWGLVSYVKNFDYTGNEQTWTVPSTGYYKVEVWGAQGGSASGRTGGYGGYSTGIIYATNNSTYYVNVGGQGSSLTGYNKKGDVGGYNGGGKCSTHRQEVYVDSNVSSGCGGGATHIATVSGLLKDLASYKDTNGTNDSNEILVVAGGGGGSQLTNSGNYGTGGRGGGYIGGKGYNISSGVSEYQGRTTNPGTQTAGGCPDTTYTYSTPDPQYLCGGFGYGGGTYVYLSNIGEISTPLSGGGAGWYGGSGALYIGSSGGSGYVGSSKLLSNSSVTKHMTCYSCSTSTAVATRTNSNSNVSATATADYSKTGNGYARITYLGTAI